MSAAAFRGVRSCTLFTSALTSLLVAAGAQAQSALPTGGTVASGSASIASNGATTTVTQSSDRAIVNWTSFDVGAGKGVVFNQPGTQSATLNRVTGGTSSTIAGSISSNGAVYLVNPNGIAITATGSVQTGGGFVASTLDIADADFTAGRLSFAGSGASKGVSNAGRITAGSGAYVALLGGTVSNSGTISVPLGKVGLGAGEQATLDLNGDGFMQVAVPSATDGGVGVAGAITAAGGRVELKAASVVGAVRNLVNLSGSISADSASGDAGSIVLLAGEGGRVTASGTLTARATGAAGNGGSVETSGADVNFTGLKVDTSAAGGRTGSWLVDPTDVTIDAGAAATIASSLANSNVTIQTTSTTPTITGTTATGVQASGPGNITVASGITWASANTLTLNAYNNVAVNAGISGTAGTLALIANGTAITQGANGAIAVATLTGSSVGAVALTNVNNQIATLGAFTTAGAFTLADGAALTLNGALNAGTGTVTLNDSGGGINAAGGAITAGTLTGSATGTTAFTAANAIGTLGTFGVSNGAFSLTNTAALTVGGGVTTSGANAIALTTIGSGAGIAVNAALTSGQDLTLNAAGTLSAGANLLTVGRNLSETAAAFTGSALAPTFASGDTTGTWTISATGSAGLSTAATLTAPGQLTVGTTAGPLTLGSVSSTNAGVALTAGSGDLTVNGTITPASGAAVGLTSSAGAVTLAKAIALPGSAVSITAGTNINLGGATSASTLTLAAGASGTITSGYGVNVGTFALTSGSWTQNAASLPAFTATNFNLNPNATFLRVTGGDGSSATPYTVTDAFGLQGIASSSLLAKNFTLANAIDLSSTSGWNGGAGFVPIGTDGNSNIWNGTAFAARDGTTSAGFTGIFDGGGFTVSGLSITRPSASYVGLFGYVRTATVKNVTVAGTVSAANDAGGLIGHIGVATGTVVTNVTSSVNITGGTSIGGLIGYADSGAISNAVATGTVGGSGANIGGLIGGAGGSTTTTIDTSSASGAVTASGGGAGGLIGLINGTVAVTGSSATGKVTSTLNMVGGLVGYQTGGASTIASSFATGAVQGTTLVGGLVGYQYVAGGYAAKITGSYATGTVTATGGGGSTGGLVGRLYINSTANGAAASIDSSYATGKVTAPTASSYTGGLIGYASGNGATILATISNSYATGVVEGGGLTGGLAGEAINTTLTDVHASGTVNLSGKTGTSVGGLIGYLSGGSLSGATAGGVYATGDTYGGSNVGGLLGYLVGGATVTNARAAGNVTATGQYSGGLIGYSNIGGAITGVSASGNAKGVSYVGGLIGYSVSSGALSGAAASGNVTATGAYTGGLIGYLNGGVTTSATVSNATASGTVVGTTQVGGLIGFANRTNGAAAISNSSASGAVQGTSPVGGLIGQLTGYSLTGSFATGTVSTTVTSSIRAVGGLVGQSTGSSTVVTGAITNSYATGNVSVPDGASGNFSTYAGGLVGYAASQYSTVSTSFATGNVTVGQGSIGTGFTYAGGLVGYAAAPITQVWAGGAVAYTQSNTTIPSNTQNTGYLGGLIGSTNTSVSQAYAVGAVSTTLPGSDLGGLIGNAASGSTVQQAYASGAVSGSGGLSGLIGINQGTVTTSYWDIYSTGQTVGATYGGTNSSAGMSAVTSNPNDTTTPSAYQSASYAGFTPSAWVFFNGQTRPFGAWEVPVSGGVINSSHALQLIDASATALAGSYTLQRSIDLSETGANQGTPATSAGMWAQTGFVPVGTNGAGGVYDGATGVFDANGVAGFSGTLDGAGYTLSNLTVARPGMLDVGLFGWTTGTLRNLTLTGAAVTGGTNVGALTGYLYNGAITGVTVGGTTAGTNNVGGIVGLMYKASLATSTASGGVTGTLNAGGAVGFEQDSTITGVSTTATAAASQAYAGGLVGYQLNGTTNSNVSASGAVSAPNGAGGLVGIATGFQNAADTTSTTAAITNASATGAVTGASGTGGLVGFLGYSASVAQAYATGAVTGTTNAGGLVGYHYNAGIADSYATGAVSGSTNVGGLVGTADGAGATIQRTYATGAVTGTTSPGGLVGSAINGATVTQSVWDTTATGQATSAGGSGATGYTTAQLQDPAAVLTVYAGWDFTSTWLQPNQATQTPATPAHYPRLRVRPTP